MSDSNSTAWLAAGVRHELFMRVLPALRHDMAGPLSVARMGATVLKRYIAAQPFDPALCLKRMEQTDEQLNQLLLSIRTLSRWDVESTDRVIPTPALHATLHLARPMLDLQGIVLETTEVDAPASWPQLQPARALYMVLGVLSQLQDSGQGPRSITVVPEGDTLRLSMQAVTPTLPGDHQPAQRHMRVDAQALQWLADDLRWPIEISADTVVLGRPDEQ
ncbi:hypothetical protein GT347_08670 [Xylophilus rhododendri]|uniref:Histidine kinase n=1 Tax=Xylophilus rhododendri TaxID=2697032 RepID=A0A857J4V6_9BURK|nr:hypothetical protein [Xylophilus rhododendri]QHI98062.1 hypothetical protein GT347_08670 [Xylophilus rhododendri]